MTIRERRALYIMIGGIAFIGWRLHGVLSDHPKTPAAAQADVLAGQAPDTDPLPGDPHRPPRNDPRWPAQLVTASQPWQRDPFRYPEIIVNTMPVVTASMPVGNDDPGPPAFRLSGISQVGGTRRAIVGDRAVGPGTVMEDGWQVTDISSASVSVRRGKFEYELRLGQDGAIRRHASDTK